MQRAIWLIPKLSRTPRLERTLPCHAGCLSFWTSLSFTALLMCSFSASAYSLLFTMENSLFRQPVLSLNPVHSKFFFTCLPVAFTHWPSLDPCGATQNKLASYFCLLLRKRGPLSRPQSLPFSRLHIDGSFSRSPPGSPRHPPDLAPFPRGLCEFCQCLSESDSTVWRVARTTDS